MIDHGVQEIEEVIPELSSKPQRVSKLEQKRQQIFNDRIQRYMGQGMSQQDAIARVQREDWERTPAEEKLKRFEGILFGNIEGLAKDMTLLKQNQEMLANIMDVNFKAFDKVLRKLGVSEEEQKKFVDEAIQEVHAEQQARKAAELNPAPPAPVEG